MSNSIEDMPIRIAKRCTPFLIANRHLFTSDRQIELVSSAGIPLRQKSPHIDICSAPLRQGALEIDTVHLVDTGHKI